MSISNLIQKGKKFMNYIENMIGIRKDNRVSQEKLARAIKWSRPQIARYETKKCAPTIDYLEAFCRYFKVSADFILDLPPECKNPRKG